MEKDLEQLWQKAAAFHGNESLQALVAELLGSGLRHVRL